MELDFKINLSDVMPQVEAAFRSHLDAQMHRLHAEIGQEVLTITKENFNSTVGRPIEWAPLSPKYAKRVGRSHATLYVSGRLFAGFQMTAGHDSAVISNDVIHAAAHQYGVSARNLPARPFVPILGDQLTAYALNRVNQRVAGFLERTARDFFKS